jgi:hypothetical protein
VCAFVWVLLLYPFSVHPFLSLPSVKYCQLSLQKTFKRLTGFCAGGFGAGPEPEAVAETSTGPAEAAAAFFFFGGIALWLVVRRIITHQKVYLL